MTTKYPFYSRFVIQTADYYLTKLEAREELVENILSVSWAPVCLYRALIGEAPLHLERLHDVGKYFSPLMDAVAQVARGAKPNNVNEIRASVVSLSKVKDEADDLKDIVVLSLYTELVAEKRLGEKFDIIDEARALEGDQELSYLVNLKLGKAKCSWQTISRDIRARGLLSVYCLQSNAGARLPRVKWVKEVSERAKYLKSDEEGVHPSSSTIEETYYGAIALRLLEQI